MRKLIISVITTAALISIACESASTALLSGSQVAATAPSVYTLPVHASHDGAPRRPGHASLFM
jgi:hypothetical protein